MISLFFIYFVANCLLIIKNKIMENNKKVIITGATGMLGKACLLECLDDDRIESVLLISRKNINIKNKKISELIIKDFKELTENKKELSGFDACFHCMGISAVGMSEADYNEITFNATKTLADVLYELNPKMIFNYISGAGTDSSEKSSMMWARVKGKTENYILNKGFHRAFAFRPGVVIPEKGVKPSSKVYAFLYTILLPFMPLLRILSSVTFSSKLGKAMIGTMFSPFDKLHIENSDINNYSEK